MNEARPYLVRTVPIVNLTAEEQRRFWGWVSKGEPDSCWNWTGRRNPGGYGEFKLRGLWRRSHRVSYFLSNGSIEPGKLVLHSCDNRRCCNPNHLREGTHKDNAQDAIARNRGLGGSRGKRGSYRKSGRKSITNPERLNFVQQIREATGSYSEIARLFGTCKSNVHYIKTLKTWKDALTGHTTNR